MAQLEARLIIGATDQTGGAFKSLKDQIAGLDRQISTFDKLAAATGKAGKSADPLINSINKSTQALEAQKASVTVLSEKLAASAGGAEEAAVGQRALGEATEATTRVMIAQGAQAARIANEIVTAQRKTVAGSRRAREESGGLGKVAGVVGGGMGGIAGMIVGGEMIHAGVESVKLAATLEQSKFKIREASKTDASEMPFAEGLARDVAKQYPSITEAEALSTYVEMRANSLDDSGTINQEKMRRNLMAASKAQVAALAIGLPMQPSEVQDLIKVVEGTGRTNDPGAIEKVLDLYIRGKQVFGTALTADKMRDFVQNAKAANFSLDDRSLMQNMARMTEGNASRLGNEIAQTFQTLVGGHMTKQTGLWLEKEGLIKGLQSQGGGKVTATGLTRSDLLQTEPVAWANEVLLPALERSGALAPDKINARMKMLRDAALKANPNAEIDDKDLRERAEEGLISAALTQSGARTTVTDQLTHAIANERLINRDVEGMLKTSGYAAASDIGQNPVAAFAEFTSAFENLGAVVVSPAVKAIAPLLDELAHAMAGLSASAERFQKAHPDLAVAGVVGGGVVGGVGAGAAFLGSLKWFGRLLGLGGGGAGPAATAAPAAEGWLPYLGRILGIPALGIGAAGSLIEGDISGNAALQERLKREHPDWTDAKMREWAAQQASALSPPKPMMGPFLPSASRVPAPWLNQAQDLEIAMRAERAFREDPEAAHGRAYQRLGGDVHATFTGQANVEQTLNVNLSVPSWLDAAIDQMRRLEYTVPLAPLGVMDDDAAPRRAPGTGHM